MNNQAEVREFLMSRRAKITPEQRGLLPGPNRRVTGLRRAEVATLAGVSVEYYSKLERGAIGGASPAVLESIAQALQLDDAERAHLFNLATAADGLLIAGRRGRATRKAVGRPSLDWVLGSIGDGVAFIRDQHHNLLATNELGRAFYAPVIGTGEATPNLARFQFLDTASHDFYPDWEAFAAMCVANMRAEAGRYPRDQALQSLISELSARSETFRVLWGAHDVRTHGSGTKRFNHPVVGEIVLAFEELAITADPGLLLLVYTAEPGSASAERLQLLANYAATQAQSAADEA